MKEFFDIAVIMVSTNDLNEECLLSLKEMKDRTSLKIGFVFVDNHSRAYQSHVFIKNYLPEAIIILRKKNFGFGSSCNRGAKEVSADYYFFLNPDTKMIDTHLFENLHSFMKENSRVGIVSPNICYFNGNLQETCRRFPNYYTPLIQRTFLGRTKKGQQHTQKFLMQDYDHKDFRMVDWVQGSALMIDAMLFHEIGGFDERFFMYFEDIDLCRECWKRGRPVYYFPQTKLFHVYGKSSGKEKRILRSLFGNFYTRTHIKSWIKFLKKWGLKKYE